MINPRQIERGQLPQSDREIAPVSRGSPVIANGFQLFPLPSPGHYVAQEVFAARAEDVSGADDDRARVCFLRTSLTFELASPVHADRSRLIALRVETVFVAVEDVVGRDGDQESAGVLTGAREVFRSEGVYLFGFGRVAFTTVDVGPRGAVDDCTGTSRGDFRFNRFGVGDVEGFVVVSKNLIAVRETMLHEGAPD